MISSGPDLPPPRFAGSRPGRRLLLLAPLLAAPVLPARAHALVVSSEPAAGARLPAAPARVLVRFNSRIDAARSRLSLVPATWGAAATQALPLELAPVSDPTLLEASCPPLEPGPWRLRWQVLAVDGHITRGDIAFEIAAGPGR